MDRLITVLLIYLFVEEGIEEISPNGEQFESFKECGIGTDDQALRSQMGKKSCLLLKITL